MVLSNSGNGIHFTFTAIAISIGFLLGEFFVQTFSPSSSGVIKMKNYEGPINTWEPSLAFDPSHVKSILPTHCRDYIVVTVKEARNLAAADTNGKSDPYVKFVGYERGKTCKVNSRKPKPLARSSTKYATLNPYWNESFVFPLINNQKEIVSRKFLMKMAVLDYDYIGSDDLLGVIDFEIDCRSKILRLHNTEEIHLKDEKVCKGEEIILKLNEAETGEVVLNIKYFDVNAVRDQLAATDKKLADLQKALTLLHNNLQPNVLDVSLESFDFPNYK
eukprot:Pgem_evm2s17171